MPVAKTIDGKLKREISLAKETSDCIRKISQFEWRAVT